MLGKAHKYEEISDCHGNVSYKNFPGSKVLVCNRIVYRFVGSYLTGFDLRIFGCCLYTALCICQQHKLFSADNMCASGFRCICGGVVSKTVCKHILPNQKGFLLVGHDRFLVSFGTHCFAVRIVFIHGDFVL